MTETFAVGDLVEAAKGEERLSGRLQMNADIARFRSGFHWHYPLDLLNHGYTLTVKAKALPPLPTEPGYYEGADFPISHGNQAYQLAGDGKWWLAGAVLTEHYMQDRMPLTRLAPVADVLGKVAQLYEGDIAPLPSDLAVVAATYGVSL